MKNRVTLPKRQRIFEALERRYLLAGNVMADTSTNPTALTIIGDGSANIITITQTAPDTFKVAGTATKVNNSNSAQTFYAPDGIFVNLQGGNDSLTMKNLTIDGELGDVGLGIMLDTGADVLLLSNVTVFSQTAIDGGEGNNALVIDKCHFNYDLGIQTYGGTDAVTITNTQVSGALQVQLGNGTANALTMVNDSVLRGTGGGPDNTDIPPGFEVLICALPRMDCGANIVGGTGVDVIAMNKVQIDCLTTIDTCGGVDSIAIVNSRFGNQPDAYGGFTAQVVDDDGSGLCIETGLGNDAVVITGTTVYGFLQIDTSGQICCPCEGRMQELAPNTSSSTKDGIDAVVLTKVNVYASEEMASATDITTDEVSSGSCCVECGALLIYTGNQVDAVTLASVCTDCYAFIKTTDCLDSNLDGTDAVVIANSKFNQEDTCTRDIGLFICTGNGNDAVSIAKTNVVGKAQIETGNGTDAVALAFLVADQICARLGAGNYDVLTVSNCTATDEVFDGGDGTGDLLNYKHLNNHFNSNAPSISGFETVV